MNVEESATSLGVQGRLFVLLSYLYALLGKNFIATEEREEGEKRLRLSVLLLRKAVHFTPTAKKAHLCAASGGEEEDKENVADAEGSSRASLSALLKTLFFGPSSLRLLAASSLLEAAQLRLKWGDDSGAAKAFHEEARRLLEQTADSLGAALTADTLCPLDFPKTLAEKRTQQVRLAVDSGVRLVLAEAFLASSCLAASLAASPSAAALAAFDGLSVHLELREAARRAAEWREETRLGVSCEEVAACEAARAKEILLTPLSAGSLNGRILSGEAAWIQRLWFSLFGFLPLEVDDRQLVRSLQELADFFSEKKRFFLAEYSLAVAGSLLAQHADDLERLSPSPKKDAEEEAPSAECLYLGEAVAFRVSRISRSLLSELRAEVHRDLARVYAARLSLSRSLREPGRVEELLEEILSESKDDDGSPPKADAAAAQPRESLASLLLRGVGRKGAPKAKTRRERLFPSGRPP